jgi:DNA-binding NarL/FixJ family response regulator
VDLVSRRTETASLVTLAGLPRESALVVVGEPGLGKTALLDQAAASASVPVLRVSVNGSEARWPMAGVSTLFTAFDDPRAAAAAERLLQQAAAGSDPLGIAQQLVTAVRDLVLPPTLLVIDDVDRMDVESQRLIAFLAGRLAGTSIRLVVTVSAIGDDGPFAALPTLRLAALPPDEALALARVSAPPEANDGVLAILAEETGGNPKALGEQLRALGRDQLIGAEPLDTPLRPTPTTVAVAGLVLAHTDPEQVDALARIALTPAARTSAPSIDRDVVEDLAARGLVRVRGPYVEVAHPLVRSLLFWRMPAKARRAAHAGLADPAATDDPRSALWHGSFVDAPVDTVPLLAAAREYAAEGLPAAAVALTERALQLGHGDRATAAAEQRALLAVAEVLLGRRFLSLAARYLAALHEFPTLADDTRRLRLRYSVDYLSGDPVHADELLLPTSTQTPEDTDALAGLLSMVATFRAEAWETDSARELLLRAEPLLADASPHTREIHAAGVELIAAVDGSLAPDAELHDGLAAAVLLERSDPSLLLLGHALSLSERYRSARRVFALVLARASRTAPVWIEAARYLSAENEIRSGNHRQALRAIDVWEAGSAVVERLREPSRANAIAWRHHAEGRPDDALAVIDLCLAHRSSARLWGSTAKLHALRGRILLHADRVDEAISALEAADAIGRDIRNPTILRHTGDLVEAYVRAGRPDDARDLTERFDADHRRRPSRWGELVLNRCRALVSAPADVQATYRAALDVFDPHDSQYERARTLDALATMLDRAGAREDHDKFAAAAAAAYEAAGLRRPARPATITVGGSQLAAQPTSTTAGTRTSGSTVILTMLTAEERAVAQKVTEGYRNREIASSLYMSQRTVELRLTQIYRKVGARSRSHLVALLT